MKEIRWENKHIDFNQALDKEYPNVLKEKDIACPDRVIAGCLEFDTVIQYHYEMSCKDCLQVYSRILLLLNEGSISLT